MLMKTRDLLFIPLALLAIPDTAQAQTSSFTGISSEFLGHRVLDGRTRAVVRLYADISSPTEAIYLFVSDTNTGVTRLETDDPEGFWQAPFGGNTSFSIGPNVIASFPDTEYDSYLTIGAPDNTNNNQLVEAGIDWTSWNNGGSLTWSPGALSQPVATGWPYPTAEGRVLLAQLTVTAGHTISGLISIDTVEFAAPAAEHYHWNIPFSVSTDLGQSFCSGGSSAGACPCGNTATPGAGCANSTGVGASLLASGSSSIALDDLRLDAASLVPSRPALLFAGTTLAGGGSGVLLGDGLRCAGGLVTRLGVRMASASGDASWEPDLATDLGLAGGETRYFQVWYRDGLGSPCSSGFNLSSGVQLLVSP